MGERKSIVYVVVTLVLPEKAENVLMKMFWF